MPTTDQTIQEIYRYVVDTLSLSQRLRLAALILNDLTQQNINLIQTHSQFNDKELEDEDELEASVDKLLDEFASHVGSHLPTLSDYAVSREGIYEDHP